MGKYVVLLNFTNQGIQKIREQPANRRAEIEGAKAVGVNIEYYMTMRPYDGVASVDAPSDEAAAAIALQIGGRGNVSTLTMKAFTEDEGDRIIASLPPTP
jgi:uncharacterized protein with GYD domain